MKDTYNNVVTTVSAALLLWFGSQVFNVAIKLTRIENDVLHIRHDLGKFEKRLTTLEHKMNE